MKYLSGRYSIIYADPPWQFKLEQVNLQDYKEGKKYTSSASKRYNTMTFEELLSLPVSSIAAKNSLLFMWSASQFLREAIQLGEAWGFKYRTIAFVWNKKRTNYGFYTLSQCEVCLVFKRGKIPKKAASNIRQYVSAKTSMVHSEKPSAVRNRIAKMFPTLRKCELFARHVVEGWDSWGNQRGRL